MCAFNSDYSNIYSNIILILWSSAILTIMIGYFRKADNKDIYIFLVIFIIITAITIYGYDIRNPRS